MHVIGCLIQRRKPPDSHVCLIEQLVRQLKDLLEQLRIKQEAEQAECKRRRDAGRFATLDIDKQHEKHHDKRVQQHK